MAGSRTEKIGTIFTRVTHLLKSGVMPKTDKPMWYDIMAAFPPRVEPRYDRFLDERSVPEILYEEDEVRVKYQKSFDTSDVMNLNNITDKYSCQRFIDTMKELKKGDPTMTDEQAFDAAADRLKLNRIDLKTEP